MVDLRGVAMSKAATIELASVTKRYGTTVAVDAVSLRIPAGTYCCLLGPSGCGKSTTLRMIAGHESVTDGDILLGNHDVTDMAPARRGTAMMFQSYALFPHLDLVDNVAFSLRMRGVAKEDRRRQALEMLKLMQMEAHADRRPAQLSGGQQQRVALARSLITHPEALLLDEPLSALDPFLKIRMRAELKKLQTRLGITFVHVTHSQEEAMALADLIIVMNDGRIEQAGTPREVFLSPKTAFVARFMGDHNVVSGRVVESVDGLVQAEVPSGGIFAAPGKAPEPGSEIDIGIRADKVRIGTTDVSGLGFTGTISNIEYQGSTVKLSVDGAGVEDFIVIVDERHFFANPVAVGDAVPLSWDAEDAIVLARPGGSPSN